ncbi:MAG: signal peptidase I [Hyphococcus sp.]|nr:MAG: signal peptidase I [Marinicaulis sp.]
MLFRTTAYGMYHIPSESMLPTLAVGDRIAVNKFAYGYSRHSVPFSLAPDFATSTGRVFSATPERGDIVVFKHPRTGQTYIKRVIGLPEDQVELKNGRLYLNGDLVERTLEETYRYREHRGGIASVGKFDEALPEGAEHTILERGDNYFSDDYGPMKIPENHLFVMGDNRDNSLDSRFEDPGVGVLPMEFLVGRAEYIIMSVNLAEREEGLKKHQGRWFSKLQ